MTEITVAITHDNQLVLLHESPAGRDRMCLRTLMCANEPLGEIIIDGLCAHGDNGRVRLAAPVAWGLNIEDKQRLLSYDSRIVISNKDGWLCGKRDSYLVLTNGRLYTTIDYGWLRKTVSSFDTDVTMVDIEPRLAANQEKLQLTSQGQLAGIRRVYGNSAQRAAIPTAWPCYVFIRTSCLQGVFGDGVPADFGTFLELASQNAHISAISVAGVTLDIETPRGLLEFAAESLKSFPKDACYSDIAADTRCSGEVIIGHNVRIGRNVRLIGPVIIGDNADVGDGAVIAGAIIGSRVRIAAKEMVHDQALIKDMESDVAQDFKRPLPVIAHTAQNNFRMWPSLSYARCIKRAIDILIATVVLLLFVPVIAIISAIVKMTSRGPIFFGHPRQGLHGKVFHCFKFRSMIVGADELQQKLRIKNEVDGPQFKMDDDPRVTPIGGFLRDTYLDEIPQFFNVLSGTMSVIGPRPSPEAENSLCAYWRDARLSVRPGITGLWQVCRTRKAGGDFQEWVHHDSQYVRQLSFTLDMWIFWKTVEYLVKAFLKQF